MTSALYNRDILRLAASIPHLGRLQRPHASAEKRSALCGSRVAVDVLLDGEGRVAALGQEVRACALGQASAALMGAHAIGRTPDELAASRDDLAGFLGGERSDPGTWPGLDIFGDARPYKARHAAHGSGFNARLSASRSAWLDRTGYRYH